MVILLQSEVEDLSPEEIEEVKRQLDDQPKKIKAVGGVKRYERR
jgi:hypothetical protein